MYRAGIWMQALNGAFLVMIQGSLWTALVATGYADVNLQEMVSYVIINLLVTYATRFKGDAIMGDRIRDGSIAMDMVLPISFKWKLFSEAVGRNLFDMLFAGVPGLIVAVAVYGAAVPTGIANLSLFFIAALLGVLLSFHIQYLLNLTAFWTVDSWYISFFTGGFLKLFGGMVVPLWFYPSWLAAISAYLPFRFCAFEPIQIYLGRISHFDAIVCILMQLVWITALVATERIVWQKASKKVFVQGG